MAKGKGRTPEAQQEIPGVLDQVVKIPALTRACRELKEARAEYQKAGLDAKEANDRVRTLMHAHEDSLPNLKGVLYYKSASGIVWLKQGKEKIVFEPVEELDEPDPIEDDDSLENV